MMRSPAPAFRLLVSAFVTLAPLVIGGCSSNSSSSPSPSPAPSTTPGTTAAVTAVSSGFAVCSACHGTDGKTTTNATKSISKTTLTLATWTSKVRSGVSGTSMTAYAAGSYSDANLQNDYTYFTTH